MASLNKVFLMGNLTRDPQLRYTPNGAAVADLGLAINRTYMTKDGDKREEVTFIDVTVWNRQAETSCQYLKKGQPVHVEGFLKMDSWDDKTTGEKRTKIKVEAERVQFLGGRRDGGGEAMGSYDEDAEQAPPPRRSAPPAGNGSNGPGRRDFSSPAPPPRRPAAPPPESDADDDIPF